MYQSIVLDLDNRFRLKDHINRVYINLLKKIQCYVKVVEQPSKLVPITCSFFHIFCTEFCNIYMYWCTSP